MSQESGAMVVLVGINVLSPIGGVAGRYSALARRTGCVYVSKLESETALAAEGGPASITSTSTRNIAFCRIINQSSGRLIGVQAIEDVHDRT